jgi:hypothetical protein
MAIKSLLKKIQREDDLIMAIDQYYEVVMEQSRKGDASFHPSSAGDCPMKIAYVYLGYDKPQKFGAQTMRKMENGTWVHKRYDNLFERMDKGLDNFELVDIECGFKHKVHGMEIRGSADAIIILNEKKLLIELKSIRSEMFYKLGETPHEEYLWQWMLYSDALDIHEGRILYENKNDQELRQYKVFWNEIVMEDVYSKLEDIYACVSKGNLPPKPPGVMTECTRWGGCMWYDECWGNIK